MCHGSWRIKWKAISNYVQYTVVRCPAKCVGGHCPVRVGGRHHDEGREHQEWADGETHGRRMQMRKDRGRG